jgi:hypothetical protein
LFVTPARKFGFKRAGMAVTIEICPSTARRAADHRSMTQRLSIRDGAKTAQACTQRLGRPVAPDPGLGAP